MAKVKLNGVMEQIRGKIGDLVFRRHFGATTVSSRVDTSGREPSSAQLRVKEQFALAAAYGRSALADPENRAFYEAIARSRQQPVFSVIVADFLKAPAIAEIDLSAYHGGIGDPIRVLATDDVEVVAVNIAIRAADGTALEEGPATLHAGAWVYPATTTIAPGIPVNIEATALDRPGHPGTKTVPRA